MRILVDIDETLNNLIETILPLYNAKYQDNLTIDDITDYNIHKFLKPECKDIFKEFMTDDLIEDLQVNEGAVEVLTELSKKNEIYFLTAAHPFSVLPKHKWLQKHFPFYSFKKLIICHNKGIVKGDIMIDDCYENTIASTCCMKVLFSKPWNVEHKNEDHIGLFYKDNWKDIGNFLPEFIEVYIQCLRGLRAGNTTCL